MILNTAVPLSAKGDPGSNPLLSYAVSTHPLPLQVATSGTIAIVVNNPGYYSDQPAEDYVAVTSITFDFGPKGSDGGDLTTVDGSALLVTPPAGWATPVISALKFTFTPPLRGGNITPKDGLLFLFADIPVNTAVGTVTLTITEIASSPGSPSQPDLFPLHSKQPRRQAQGIGKFPAHFAVNDLVARPPNVPAGGETTLSWSGTVGAAYEIHFGAKHVTQHRNKVLLQPTDLFPNTAAGDPPLSLQASTIFTLTVTYTPPGGSTPAVFQRQVSVGVIQPEPTIKAFTISPPWLMPNLKNPLNATLTWQSENGAGGGSVGFELDPPLSAAELAANPSNNFFNTVHTRNGQATFNFTQGHRVTITVTGHPDAPRTQRSINFASLQAPKEFGGGVSGKSLRNLIFTPDGAYGFLLATPSPALTVIQLGPNRDPRTWTSTPLLANENVGSAVVTPDGNYLLVLQASRLLVYAIDRTKLPAGWPMVTITNPESVVLEEIAVSPDGKYAYAVGHSGIFLAELPPGQPPSSWKFRKFSAANPISISVTPNGRFLVGLGRGGSSLFIMEIVVGASPAQWPITTLPIKDFAGRICVSRDSRYIFVGQGSSVSVIDTARTANPAQWGLDFFQNFWGMFPGIGVAPDGQFGFVISAGIGYTAAGTLAAFRLVPDASPTTWPIHHVNAWTETFSFVTVSPDGRFVFVSTSEGKLAVWSVTPPLSTTPSASA